MKRLVTLAVLSLALCGCGFHVGYHTESHSYGHSKLTDPSTGMLMGQDGTFSEPATMLVGLTGGGLQFTLADGTVVDLPERHGTVGVYSIRLTSATTLQVDKSDGSSAFWTLEAIPN